MNRTYFITNAKAIVFLDHTPYHNQKKTFFFGLFNIILHIMMKLVPNSFLSKHSLYLQLFLSTTRVTAICFHFNIIMRYTYKQSFSRTILKGKHNIKTKPTKTAYMHSQCHDAKTVFFVVLRKRKMFS